MFDLDHATVKTPTPRGTIHVEWQRTGKTADLQVLIFSSGEADDAEAARSSCGQLGNAGIRVSALGIDPDVEGEKLLADCAGATGGYYETVVGSIGEQYELQVFTHVDDALQLLA